MMAAVAFATKRMWLKRWNRAGWILTGALKIPFYPLIWMFVFAQAWVRSWEDKSSDMYWGGWIMIVVLTAAISVGTWQSHLGRNATAEEIAAARQADGCFNDTIVRRAAQWQRPITVRDVVITQDDCAEMWKKIREMDAQKAALAAQLRK